MTSTISMQDMRHLNLFESVTRIRTRFCFRYNETIFFCVPKTFLFKAIGKEGRNIKKISQILGKRIRIIPIPQDEKHAKEFIRAIVSPIEFNDLDIKGSEVILTAGSRNKAALLGRNKRRLAEMQVIINDFFGKEFRIV